MQENRGNKNYFCNYILNDQNKVMLLNIQNKETLMI